MLFSLDSAPSFNLVKEEFVKDVNCLSKRLVSPCRLNTATGISCVSENAIVMEIEIRVVKFEVKFRIMKGLPVKRILGLPFLRMAKMRLNFEKG